MGDKADDILTSFSLTEDQAKSYDTVKYKFDKHFIPQRNMIFERARFNSRKQEEDETVDAFVTALHRTGGTLQLWDPAQRDDTWQSGRMRGYQRRAAVGTSATRRNPHAGNRS